MGESIFDPGIALLAGLGAVMIGTVIYFCNPTKYTSPVHYYDTPRAASSEAPVESIDALAVKTELQPDEKKPDQYVPELRTRDLVDFEDYPAPFLMGQSYTIPLAGDDSPAQEVIGGVDLPIIIDNPKSTKFDKIDGYQSPELKED